MGGVQMEQNEIDRIQTLFNDISVPIKSVKSIDRDGFKKFHLLPEPLSDRIFNLFEQKKSNTMSFDDLLSGLAVCSKASEKDKVHVIFKFLDIDDDGVITKEEISVLSVVSLENPNSPKIFSQDPQENPLLSQVIAMGFPKHKVNLALKETKNGSIGTPGSNPIENIVTWLLANHSAVKYPNTIIDGDLGIDEEPPQEKPIEDKINLKPDPKSIEELTIGLNLSTILTTFEGLFDVLDKEGGKITSAKFKKWASNSKKPQELDSLLKPIAALYDRAIKWKSDSTLNQSSEAIQRSTSNSSISSQVSMQQQQQTNGSINSNNTSLQDINNPNPKELKRYSSVSVMETSSANKKAEKEKEKAEKAAEKEKEKAEKAAKKAAEKEKEKSEKSEKSVDKSSDKSFEKPANFEGVVSPIKESGSISKDNNSTTIKSSSASISGPKKDNDTSSSFDSDSDDEVIKPAIQVVIRDKPIELQKQDSLFNIDPSIGIIKPMAGKQSAATLRSRGSRSNRNTIDPEMFSLQPLTPVSKQHTTTTTTTNTNQSNTPSPTLSSPISNSPTLSNNRNPLGQSNTIVSSPPAFVQSQSSASFFTNNSNNTQPPTTTSLQPTTKHNVSFTDTASSNSNPASPISQKINSESIEFMKKCINKLESGQFKDAIQDIDQCIRVLLQIHSSNYSIIQNEVNFCVGYRVALNILNEINIIEQKIQKETNTDDIASFYESQALLSKFLVDIPLQNNHRIVCAKMAIKYNLLANNFGIASKLIGALTQKSNIKLEEKSQYESQLSQCKENHFNNSGLPMYICPSCKSPTGADSIKCSCGRPVRWCFQTFSLIKDLTFLQCNFCNSTFSINQYEVVPKSICPCCSHGIVITKN
ncbi:hypothetical protein DICPUDRAFT_157457 [Dictyostelium purpureum]|uniref:EF-hand domain-containing protein n=1 Tax=Dictyostelium purpureum TaxID=5786 RepID=F0ZZ64_DICPU|nr:uncharacterized protein DICPUDRAFT_157457 [Dictyostelium purpureum]EGC30766.1 hypothetical protein DICPUDRAFT_157457 [Dictyostelium purpureum]|eukprot:XP_003292706.1 hypothetical protein DICPUDRAFT_157457 [Dictyostelium purpureum]